MPGQVRYGAAHTIGWCLRVRRWLRERIGPASSPSKLIGEPLSYARPTFPGDWPDRTSRARCSSSFAHRLRAVSASSGSSRLARSSAAMPARSSEGSSSASRKTASASVGPGLLARRGPPIPMRGRLEKWRHGFESLWGCHAARNPGWCRRPDRPKVASAAGNCPFPWHGRRPRSRVIAPSTWERPPPFLSPFAPGWGG